MNLLRNPFLNIQIAFLRRQRKLSGAKKPNAKKAKEEDVMKGGLYDMTNLVMRGEIQSDQRHVSSGKSWTADQLRLKSSEDLHKLWYTMLKEKNAIQSDNLWKLKSFGKVGQQGKMSQLKVSMARLLTILNERKKVREDYRKYLEEEYVDKKREEFEKIKQEQDKKDEEDVIVPKITFNLLRAKYRALSQGIDNTDYIKKALQLEQEKRDLKLYLDEKYDYKNKKIIKDEKQLEERQKLLESKAATQQSQQGGTPKLTSEDIIKGFKNGIMDQLMTGRYKITQDEVLRSHVRNWKQLNLIQRRRILGYINGLRAAQARKEFTKELSLLGQKIAHDNKKKQSLSTSI